MARASIVIASHNKHAYLAATLACLARQVVPADEVIVVDDASDPPLSDAGGGARLVRRDAGAPEGAGPVPGRHVQAARNLGIALARADLVLLLDDDCLVRDDWVQSHVWRHARDPGHLVVGSVQRVAYQGEEEFWTLPAVAGVEEHRTFERRAALLPAGVPPWNLAPCSNNASVAREALLQVGGYDEEYCGWGVDDVDLTYRLMRSGVPLLIDSAPVVYHQEHPRSQARQAAEESRNLRVFARHHGFWAYGIPPADYTGAHRYPEGGAWFRARAILRDGEPPAIRVTSSPAPGADAPHERWPLDWVLGGVGRPEALAATKGV